MKITLNIDDALMQRLREEAAQHGRPMGELLEAGLHRVPARDADEPVPLAALPSLKSGGMRIDAADHEQLEEVMGGR